MSYRYGTRVWLNSCAKKTGIPWCEWPTDLSNTTKPCITCVRYYSQKGDCMDLTKHLYHVKTQQRKVSSIREKHKEKFRQPRNGVNMSSGSLERHTRTGDDNKYCRQVKDSDTICLTKAVSTTALSNPEERTQRQVGQYCSYHHDTYGRRCHCKRDREGFLIWYNSYDTKKYCVRCDSLSCDCSRNKDGHTFKKIIVKEVYEVKGGKCDLHNQSQCDCADSIKCVVTETFDGTSFSKLCTLHIDTGCDCGEDPSFYKIIKRVPDKPSPCEYNKDRIWEFNKKSVSVKV